MTNIMKDYTIYKEKIAKLFNDLADWIYKKKCYFCRSSKENVKMCSKCFDSIEHNEPNVNRIILDTKIYCATEYSNTIQKLIRGVKYHNQKDLAYYQAKIMAKYLESLNLNNNFQIVPVPLFKSREKARKYNHMNLVGEELAQITGFSLNKTLVKRIKNTKPQYKLNRTQRMENLDNAFEIDITQYQKGKTILLIDDICTTGATFESIIKALNEVQICDIICLATATPNF